MSTFSRNTTAIPVPLNRPIDSPTILQTLLCALYLGVVVFVIYLAYQARRRTKAAQSNIQDEEKIVEIRNTLPYGT